MPKRIMPSTPAQLSLTPYQGWCWRGADLAIAELAAYHPGEITLHLGEARARLGPEREFGVLFRVFAHQAWIAPGDPEEILFPADSHFLVREVQPLSEARVCFCLEQELGDAGTDPGLMEAFRAWLPTVIGSLPKADPDLAAAWAEPFARWDRDAEAGDAPQVGIVYEDLDALAFTVACTGEDEASVKAVLDAHQRYLELAGTAQGPQDEDLLREREIMRHLLPEDPGNLDYDQEVAYLKLVTGLEVDVIDRIQYGEFQYCVSIGLINTPEKEEEDEDEGILLVDHTGHWEAAAGDQALLMDELYFGPPDSKNLRVCVPSPDPAWTTLIASAEPQEGALETLRIHGETEAGTELIAVFPVARDGAPHRLWIERVVPATLGCEAHVEATTAAGARLCYFDVDHLHPWNEREEGGEATVALAGFAYALGPAPGQDLGNGARRKLRETQRLGLKVDPSLLGYLEAPEAAWDFAPCEGGRPDDQAFLGQVETLDELQAWGGTVYRMDLSVLCQGEPFSLPVYATEKTLDGYRPWPGDLVHGRLWLQGGLPGGKGRTAIISTGDDLD